VARASESIPTTTPSRADGLTAALGEALAGWVDRVHRHARTLIAVDLTLTVLLAGFVLASLGVNMDNKRLVAPDLPFQQAAAAFARHFPLLEDSLLIVVDAETPEAARDATRALSDRLGDADGMFTDVYVPGGAPFFRQRALLYRTPEELDDFVDHLARLQPIIGELSRDQSIGNLARLIRIGLDQERASGTSPEDWARVLDRVGEATVRVFDEYPISVSWERLMLEGSALDPGTRQVIITEPVLEFSRLLAARRPIEVIRDAARDLGLTPESGVRVRITGNPALNYEEMLGLAWDVGYAGVLSFALVTVILFLAFRSLRLVSAAAITLLCGLVWTAAFAAASVGALNLLSIAFGVLFIGLGVDFAIHLGMQYTEAVRRGADSVEAWREAMRRVGGSLVMCTITTAIGFYVFVPTDYRGVAELGLISGTGMIVILGQTITLFPALVTLLLGDNPRERLRPPIAFRLAPPRIVGRHPGIVTLAAGTIAVLAAVQLPHLRFDSNVLAIRDPGTESVQTFNDLLADSHTSPWTANAMARDLADAERRAGKIRALDEVKSTLTLADYVPRDQDEKLEILADAAMLFDVPTGPTVPRKAVPVEDQVDALRDLHETLGAAWLKRAAMPLAGSAGKLDEQLKLFLDRVAREGDPAGALAQLQSILLDNFPAQVERLRLALAPPRIEIGDLPGELTRRMVAPAGQARVQIFPREDLSDTAALARFVDAVRAIEPDAAGVAVNVMEFGRATARSLRQALLSALLAIALLLWLLWRRVVDMLLVLMPLVLAGVMTGALMVQLDLPFNFGNVVVLPLLLGIGVDSGIHLVHRSHFLAADPGALLETTTAHAVFFSALTTIASFGSLTLSAHGGTASMGALLVWGLVMTLVSNLIVLPALVTVRARRRALVESAAVA
jgi:hopanoid biosynthesis associated RND transporter like protein HpnN